jgi:hypothetical protein
VNEPQVRLHDVSIDGDVGDPEALLAAVERAVAAATSPGSASPEAVRAAISSSVSERRQP